LSDFSWHLRKSKSLKSNILKRCFLNQSLAETAKEKISVKRSPKRVSHANIFLGLSNGALALALAFASTINSKQSGN